MDQLIRAHARCQSSHRLVLPVLVSPRVTVHDDSALERESELARSKRLKRTLAPRARRHHLQLRCIVAGPRGRRRCRRLRHCRRSQRGAHRRALAEDERVERQERAAHHAARGKAGRLHEQVAEDGPHDKASLDGNVAQDEDLACPPQQPLSLLSQQRGRSAVDEAHPAAQHGQRDHLDRERLFGSEHHERALEHATEHHGAPPADAVADRAGDCRAETRRHRGHEGEGADLRGAHAERGHCARSDEGGTQARCDAGGTQTAP
eukprot:6080741-Prymnesium_polylepis.2